MKYSKLESYVSRPRLQRFLTASGNSKSKAQRLYHVNLKLAQAFYPVLNLFEVFLRNTCNYHITTLLKDSNWIITEKDGFMSHHSLSPSRYYLKQSVLNAELKIKKKGNAISSGTVIAEQNFGFWTSLFETPHYKLIKGVVIHCFPHKPVVVNRSIINRKLNRIREFRNRVYHNEPICFNGKSVDFTYTRLIKEELFELLEWIDPDLSVYVKSFPSIEKQIRIGESINTTTI